MTCPMALHVGEYLAYSAREELAPLIRYSKQLIILYTILHKRSYEYEAVAAGCCAISEGEKAL